MSIIIPNALTSPSLLLDLQRVKSQDSNYVSQISTGLQNVNLGDDPSSAASVLNLQQSINQTQDMANIDTATSFQENTASVITSMGTAVTSLMSLAQEGMSGTQSTTSMTAIAAQVDATTQDLLNLGNTQVQGNPSIFGGTDTPRPRRSRRRLPSSPHPGAARFLHLQRQQRDHQPGRGHQRHHSHQCPRRHPVPGRGRPRELRFRPGPVQRHRHPSAALKAGNTARIQTAYTNLKAINDHLNDVLTQVGGWTWASPARRPTSRPSTATSRRSSPGSPVWTTPPPSPTWSPPATARRPPSRP